MIQKIYRLNDRGVALIAGLLILVVLSILGITTMQSSLLQERMAGNFEQRDIAFQVAEAGLRSAENFLLQSVVLPPFNNTNGLYGQDSNLWKGTEDWWNATDKTKSGSFGSRYYVEEILTEIDISDSLKFGSGASGTATMYRITSRGIGSGPIGRQSIVFLQSTYMR